MDFGNVRDIQALGGDVRKIQLTIWVKKGNGKYIIRKNDEVVDYVTIPELQRMIGDGTAQSRFGIGATIEIPFLYDGQTIADDVPFIFGTFRNFTLEDGSVKLGLGLESKYCCVYGLHDFPGNVLSANGFSWGVSQTRRFMNGSGANWALYTDNVSFCGKTVKDAYSGAGMLDFLPVDLVDVLRPVKVVTALYTEGQSSATTETTYDRFFILSTSEKHVYFPTFQAGNTNTEGAVWEYWAQRQPTQAVASSTSPSTYSSFYTTVLPKYSVPSYITFRTFSKHGEGSYTLLTLKSVLNAEGVQLVGLSLRGVDPYALPACALLAA